MIFFYVTCNICILVQTSRGLDGHHRSFYIGGGNDGKTSIPFTMTFKIFYRHFKDIYIQTYLHTNISKQCFSSLLMQRLAPNTTVLGISSEKHLPGSSGFSSKLLPALETALMMLFRSTLPCSTAASVWKELKRQSHKKQGIFHPLKAGRGPIAVRHTPRAERSHHPHSITRLLSSDET